MADVMSFLEEKHSIAEKTESRQAFIDETLQSHGLDRTTDLDDPRWASANAAWRKRYQGELDAISATPMTDTPDISDLPDKSEPSLELNSENPTSATAIPKDSTSELQSHPGECQVALVGPRLSFVCHLPKSPVPVWFWDAHWLQD